MANAIEKNEQKIIINGGNIYQNTVEIDNSLTHSLHELYFGAYQNLINHIGVHPNLEIGMHVSITKEFIPYTNKQGLRCKIETIPIIEQEYRCLKIEPTIEPCMPHNRKCTFKERLKILFKGGL